MKKIPLGPLIAVLVLTAVAESYASELIEGPVPATVVRVIDGDTIVVRAHPWVGLAVTTKVRLAGIDAPEIRGKCVEEREAGIKSRLALSSLIGPGRQVKLYSIELGKFAGRVIAIVRSTQLGLRGRSLSDELVLAGHARAYEGREKRGGWCPKKEEK